MNEGQTPPQGIMENTLCVFLFGAAVGVSVALLYAPRSGQDTRTKIAEKANNAVDSAGEWTNKAIDTAGEWKDRAMSAAQETLGNVAETIQSARDGARSN